MRELGLGFRNLGIEMGGVQERKKMLKANGHWIYYLIGNGSNSEGATKTKSKRKCLGDQIFRDFYQSLKLTHTIKMVLEIEN